MKSLQGSLLVASGDMLDGNFNRTVLLLVQHTKEGALGLVLNRPTEISIRDAWEKVQDSPCAAQAMLYHGGPCAGPLMAVHGNSEMGDARVLKTVYFTAAPEKLAELVQEEESATRFFVGYAGWGPEQLEAELDQGAWRTLRARPEHLFPPPDGLWDEVMEELGKRALAAVKPRHVPSDPTMN